MSYTPVNPRKNSWQECSLSRWIFFTSEIWRPIDPVRSRTMQCIVSVQASYSFSGNILIISKYAAGIFFDAMQGKS